MRKFKNSDYDILRGWFHGWNLPAPPQEVLPRLGLICDDVACGFMYIADRRIGWLDFYISNPESKESIRDRVLDEITATLIESAKRFKLKGIMANTQIKAVTERAMLHRFEYLGEFSALFRRL